MSKRLGRQLYVPALHLWYRPVPPELLPPNIYSNGPSSSSLLSTTSNNSTWTVEIGMTDRGISELGEISGIQQHKSIRDTVRQGDEVLSLAWGYHVIKTINEPSWTVVSGTYRLRAPVCGKIEYIMDSQDICNEDEVLLTLSADADSVQDAIFPLVTEREYLRLLEARGSNAKE
jgi:hypothetical protein